jgi:hypothetical protein
MQPKLNPSLVSRLPEHLIGSGIFVLVPTTTAFICPGGRYFPARRDLLWRNRVDFVHQILIAKASSSTKSMALISCCYEFQSTNRRLRYF